MFLGPQGPTPEQGMQGPEGPVPFEPMWQIPPGEKANRAERISRHMSWQLLEEMEEWEEGMDTLLHTIPIMGVQFKKTYYNRLLGRNVSELVDALDLVMQYKAPWATVPRKTQHVRLYPYEVTERKRSGTFLDIDLIDTVDEGKYLEADGNDEDAPQLFLEQHRLLDLDDDGYPEPYIVTVHKQSSKVVRILARFEEEGIQENRNGQIVRIAPIEYYTRYLFMPAPDGGIYGMGFGWLLHDISNSVNTTINQLLDAGTLANVGGGFIGKGLRIKSGDSTRKLGEWKHVSSSGAAIRDNLYELKMPQPSPVLFQLLGLLIDAGKEISSVKDVLTGEAPKNAPATTTMAMVEQGQKVFTAIYKRLHRGLRDELKKLYRLNRLYLEPEVYFVMLDGNSQQVALNDYNDEDMDIIPVSDPALVSDMQRMSKAEYLYQLAQTEPNMNRKEALSRMLEAGKFEDREKLILDEVPPDPEMMMEMQRAENDTTRAQAGAQESQGKAQLAQATAQKMLVDAEQKGIETQLDIVRLDQDDRKLDQQDTKLALDDKKIDADSRKNSGNNEK
jgi:chaperonin GroES